MQIQNVLLNFKIKSKIKKRKGRTTSTLIIYGKNNLIKFQKEINFLHPAKNLKLQQAINSFVNYNWTISKNLIKQKIKIKKPFLIRIVSKVKENLIQIQKFLNNYKIESKIYQRKNGLGTTYYTLMVYKKDSVLKAIKNGLIIQEQLSKINNKLYKQ